MTTKKGRISRSTPLLVNFQYEVGADFAITIIITVIMASDIGNISIDWHSIRSSVFNSSALDIALYSRLKPVSSF